ncbi:hypothetical protein PIB30_097656 [Stylosanthes scabra]|uniref:Uncharacterized protein n=1 Tax=Stylosanthes scabra TaxID=79078 RepID=A0ABU6UXH0_9FABA|nr:hypothetical protein [Stylosanthes scabra]
MGKAKEGIEGKGFMKRSKNGGFWILQVASEVASETLEQRAILILSRQSCVCNFHTCIRNFLPEAFFELSGTELHTQLSKVAYATIRCCNILNEGQNWNFTFPGLGLAPLKRNLTYMGGKQLKHKAYFSIDSPLGSIGVKNPHQAGIPGGMAPNRDPTTENFCRGDRGIMKKQRKKKKIENRGSWSQVTEVPRLPKINTKSHLA